MKLQCIQYTVYLYNYFSCLSTCPASQTVRNSRQLGIGPIKHVHKDADAQPTTNAKTIWWRKSSPQGHVWKTAKKRFVDVEAILFGEQPTQQRCPSTTSQRGIAINQHSNGLLLNHLSFAILQGTASCLWNEGIHVQNLSKCDQWRPIQGFEPKILLV